MSGEAANLTPMLVKIKKTEARLGMHVQEVCCAWIDNPFWKASFVLRDPKDLEKLRASKADELIIDVSKGLSVEQALAAERQAEREKIKSEQVSERGARDVEASERGEEEQTGRSRTGKSSAIEHEEESRAKAAAVALRRNKVSLGDEVIKSGKICKESRAAVKALFGMVRTDGDMTQAESARGIVDGISASVARNAEAIISVARAKTKDEFQFMHSIAACALMVGLAKQMGLGEREVSVAGLAGLLHDIGNMAVPARILNKPSGLTPEEFTQVRSHPNLGVEMLEGWPDMPEEVIGATKSHHERVNGKGYPEGLAGDDIPLMARMCAVVDMYDAITSDRHHRKGLSPADAIAKMAEWRHGHLDEMIFQAFVKSIGIYPTGSLVKLESKRLAVVCEQGPQSLLSPKVKVFYSIRSGERMLPQMLDLSKAEDKIISKEDPKDWGFDDIDELWRT